MKKTLLTISFLIVFLAAQSQNNDLQYQVFYGLEKTDSRKEINIPGILGYQTVKCDFHIHTIFSDGQVLPQERVNEAWREGLDVIAITDHSTSQPRYIKGDYNTSYEMAKSTARNRGITLIKAIEYTSSKPVGHLNFLFIDESNQYADKSITPGQAVELAASKGAFVIYNHPGWPDKNSDLFNFQLDFIRQKKIHAMEVINGPEFYPVVVDYCNQYNLAPLSTSDIHTPVQVTYDLENKHRNMTLVFAKDKSEESVKEALFAGRTVAYGDNVLVGKEEYLLELIKKSLVVSNLKITDSQFSCDITNRSDITYLLDGPAHSRITFPANRTIQLREEIKNADIIYQVYNTYISSVKHVELPLYFILADEIETGMPYIKQNLTLIDPATKIEVFSPTPGSEIRYTFDGTEPTSTSLLYTAPITLNNSAAISIRGFKQGMKPSRVFKTQILLNILNPAEKLSAPKNGISFRYFEGMITSVNEIERQGKFVNEGIEGIPDISKAKTEDHFGMIFTGYIYAPIDGLYTFSTRSDDGSVFRIGGLTVVDNDGSHSETTASGRIALKKGYHPFELLYFEDYEGQYLSLSWIIPGTAKKEKINARYFYIK